MLSEIKILNKGHHFAKSILSKLVYNILLSVLYIYTSNLRSICVSSAC